MKKLIKYFGLVLGSLGVCCGVMFGLSKTNIVSADESTPTYDSSYMYHNYNTYDLTYNSTFTWDSLESYYNFDDELLEDYIASNTDYWHYFDDDCNGFDFYTLEDYKKYCSFYNPITIESIDSTTLDSIFHTINFTASPIYLNSVYDYNYTNSFNGCLVIGINGNDKELLGVSWYGYYHQQVDEDGEQTASSLNTSFYGHNIYNFYSTSIQLIPFERTYLDDSGEYTITRVLSKLSIDYCSYNLFYNDSLSITDDEYTQLESEYQSAYERYIEYKSKYETISDDYLKYKTLYDNIIKSYSLTNGTCYTAYYNGITNVKDLEKPILDNYFNWCQYSSETGVLTIDLSDVKTLMPNPNKDAIHITFNDIPLSYLGFSINYVGSPLTIAPTLVCEDTTGANHYIDLSDVDNALNTISSNPSWVLTHFLYGTTMGTTNVDFTFTISSTFSTLSGSYDSMAKDINAKWKQYYQDLYDTNIDEIKHSEYQRGLSDGDNEGATILNSFKLILDYPITFLTSVFNFEIFGYNISKLILFTITLGVVGMAIHFIKRK